MALLEALACGVPAVVTDAGAAREIIQEGINGCVVPVGDAKSMAARVGATSLAPESLRESCIVSVAHYQSSRVVATMLPALGFGTVN